MSAGKASQLRGSVARQETTEKLVGASQMHDTPGQKILDGRDALTIAGADRDIIIVASGPARIIVTLTRPGGGNAEPLTGDQIIAQFVVGPAPGKMPVTRVDDSGRYWMLVGSCDVRVEKDEHDQIVGWLHRFDQALRAMASGVGYLVDGE